MPPTLRSLRPDQWVKNLFVAAPLIFSKNLFEGPIALRALLATVTFCAISSAVYVLNDLFDCEADRLHSEKRYRPVASGALGRGQATVLVWVLAITSIVGAFALDWRFAGAVAGYMALNVAYSRWLKHVAFVDVLSIAGGFLLRVRGGAWAIDVPASSWLLLCTGLLAMFLGYGKRAHELRSVAGAPSEQRRVLSRYSEPLLWAILWALGAATLAAYVAYTRATHTVAFFGSSRLAYTAPCVAFGLGRFLWLVARRPHAESPTMEMLQDPWFIANWIVWMIAVGGVIYGD